MKNQILQVKEYHRLAYYKWNNNALEAQKKGEPIPKLIKFNRKDGDEMKTGYVVVIEGKKPKYYRSRKSAVNYYARNI